MVFAQLQPGTDAAIETAVIGHGFVQHQAVSWLPVLEHGQRVGDRIARHGAGVAIVLVKVSDAADATGVVSLAMALSIALKAAAWRCC